MRLLVTGGAGYIGGFTTRLLTDAGHEVTVVDNLATGQARAVGEASLLTGDVGDRDLVGRILRERRIEAVLHFAALKSVSGSWEGPDRYRAVNVEGTASLLAAMAESGVDVLVYSGTCAVYGTPARLPVDETAETAPLNPYGETKLAAERLVREAGERVGLRWCSLRYFNAAGAAPDGSYGESPDGAVSLIPRVISAALGGAPHVPIYGTDYPTPDGTAIRDYIHVLDLASAHLRALEHLAAGGRSDVFNLGTGHGSSVRAVITAAERVVGRPIPVDEQPRRLGDPPAVWADARRAQRVLGWQARYGIEEIVGSAWRWQSRGVAAGAY